MPKWHRREQGYLHLFVSRRGWALDLPSLVIPSLPLPPLPCCSLFPLVVYKMSSSSTNSIRPVVFMDINIGETPAGRLKMELFSDIVPK